MLKRMPDNISILRNKNNENAPKAPFFCIHPITGIGDQVYLPLARQLKDDRDFYAISSTMLTDTIGDEKNSITVSKTIDELAYQYIRFIKEIQPKGPYCLGGFSFGGLVAFRMALILEGPYYDEKVAFLGIFDTAFMNINSWNTSKLADYLVSTLAALIEGYPALKVDILQKEDLKKFNSKETMIKAAFSKVKIQLKDIDFNEIDKLNHAVNQGKQFKEILKYSMHHVLAAAKYKIYPDEQVDQITLFVATESKTINNTPFSAIINDEESVNNWKQHSKNPIRILPIKANHFNIIENRDLAEQVEGYLRAIDTKLIAGNAVQQLIDLLSSIRKQQDLMPLFRQELIQQSQLHPEVADILAGFLENKRELKEIEGSSNNNVSYALKPASQTINQDKLIISHIPNSKRALVFSQAEDELSPEVRSRIIDLENFPGSKKQVRSGLNGASAFFRAYEESNSTSPFNSPGTSPNNSPPRTARGKKYF